MKYIITISLLLFSFCSFGQTAGELKTIQGKWVTGLRIDTIKAPECKHIYVAVEPTEISGGVFSTTLEIRIGKHDGREIVCVKCFHVRSQVIEYGQPLPMSWFHLPPDTLRTGKVTWQVLTKENLKNGNSSPSYPLPRQLPQKDKRITLEVREQK